jgi:DNA-binding NarL/FixJ family response regulator
MDYAVMVGASVLVVDDHAGFRETVHQLLELEGYTVVGEAADGHSALLLARKLQPDIALIDVHLPDMDGFELTARLKSLENPPLVILTSSRDGVDFTTFVAKSGARGFVPKAELSREAIEGALP